MTQKKLTVIVILILIITNIVTLFMLVTNYNTLQSSNELISLQKTNAKVVIFTRLVVDKILKSSGTVDFNTRLQLENTVRDLADAQILNQWDKFVNSEGNDQAQAEMKNLLDLLISKINIIE